jgi:hypothetical protein
MPQAGKTQQKYFQGWYEENGDDWNERRRQRYAEDPEYRKKVRRWNKEARNRRKVEERKEKRAARKAMKIQPSGAWKTIEVEVDGVKTRMFTIGALARVLGKGISTIRVWEKKGVLPETPHRSSKGDRLYTVEMVEAIQETLWRVGKLERTKEVVRKKKKPSYVVRKVKFKGQRKPQEVQLFKIGSLAKAVGRTVVALTQMEKRGVLPRTPLVASSLARWR